MSTPTLSLVRKLAEVAHECRNLDKRGHNPHHKYNYVLSTDVYEAIRPLLAQRSVFLAQKYLRAEWHPKGVRIEWEFEFIDGDSGERLCVPWVSEAMDTQDKSANKAATAARKYFLITQFQIPVEVEDADRGPDPGKPAAAPRPRQQAPATQQAPPQQAPAQGPQQDLLRLTRLAKAIGQTGVEQVRGSLVAAGVWPADRPLAHTRDLPPDTLRQAVLVYEQAAREAGVL